MGATKVIGMLAACACALIAGPAIAANSVPAAVTTGAATAVTGTSATLNGTVNPEGQATTYFFEYGTSTAYGSTAPAPPADAGAGTASVNAYAQVASLAPNTTYHFRLVATNASGPVDGLDQMFTTAPSAPVVTTGGVSAVTATSATLTGTVNPGGQATTYAFVYGTTTAYGGTAPSPPASAGAGTTNANASAPVASLAPSATYHYRLVATNASGTIQGTDHTFKTKPATASPGAPLVKTGGASAVTVSSATLTGTVNPKGQATVYAFQYGTSPAYGRTVPAGPASIGAGTANVNASAPVASLAPGTTYHYRIIATNASGTNHGSDRVFKTKTASRPVVITGGVSAARGTTATLTGTLNPHGQATSYYFQYGPSAKYGGRAPTPAADAGTGTASVKVSVAVTSLVPETTYHFRLVATNALGSKHGADHVFKTGPGITIFASPNPIAFGQRTTVGGAVFTRHRTGASVTLQVSGSATGRFHTVARTTAGKKGVYAFHGRAPSSGTYYRTRALGLTSAPLLVPVRFKVSLLVSNRHPARGHSVRFHGLVSPRRNGMRVLVQRLGPHRRWQTLARPRLHHARGNTSAYSVSLAPPLSGLYRVVAGPRAGHARGYSRGVRIRLH